MVTCAVCNQPAYTTNNGRGGSLQHPLHPDAELAETKLAVDLAAKVLTVGVLLWMAREAAMA